MHPTIDLTTSEHAQITQAAKQSGLAPAEVVRNLVKEYLPSIPPTDEADIDDKLRGLQELDGKQLRSDVSTQSLFAQWAEEDAQMTEEERAKNERVYAEIEKNGIPRVQI